MTISIVSVTDLRTRFPEVAAKVSDGPVLVIQRSKPLAVLCPVDEWDRIQKDLKGKDKK